MVPTRVSRQIASFLVTYVALGMAACHSTKPNVSPLPAAPERREVSPPAAAIAPDIAPTPAVSSSSSLQAPFAPAYGSAGEVFVRAVKRLRPVFEGCANISDSEPWRSRCMCNTVCRVRLPPSADGSKTDISYPPPFALSVGFLADGTSTQCRVVDTQQVVDCRTPLPSAPELIAKKVEQVDHLSEVVMDGADFAARGQKETISWTHGGPSGAWISRVTVELDVAPGGAPHKVAASAAWHMVGSCRGPTWYSARPLSLRATNAAAMEPGKRRPLVVEFEPLEVYDSCMAVRVRLDVDGTMLELDVPYTTYQFEPDSIDGELIQ